MSYRTIFHGKIKIEPVLSAMTVYGLREFSRREQKDLDKWPRRYCP